MEPGALAKPEPKVNGWGAGCKEDVDTAAVLSGGAGDVSCGGCPEPSNDWGLPKEGACVFVPKMFGDDAAPGVCCEAPKAKGFGMADPGVPKAGAAWKPNGAEKPVPECGVADD